MSQQKSVDEILDNQFGVHIRMTSDTTEGVIKCLKHNVRDEILKLIEEALPKSEQVHGYYDRGFNSCLSQVRDGIRALFDGK